MRFTKIALTGFLALFAHHAFAGDSVCPTQNEIKQVRFETLKKNRVGVWFAYSQNFLSHGMTWKVRLAFNSQNTNKAELIQESQSLLADIDGLMSGGLVYSDEDDVSHILCNYITNNYDVTLSTLAVIDPSLKNSLKG